MAAPVRPDLLQARSAVETDWRCASFTEGIAARNVHLEHLSHRLWSERCLHRLLQAGIPGYTHARTGQSTRRTKQRETDLVHTRRHSSLRKIQA